MAAELQSTQRQVTDVLGGDGDPTDAGAAARESGRDRYAAALRGAGELLRRPYRVPATMVLLVALVPLYVFIPELFLDGRTLHSPATPLDDLLPLWPAWAIVYGALYLFLVVVPLLTIRDPGLIRRAVRAYLLVWLTAYVVFVAFPTVAPRPAAVAGAGFGSWGLRMLYGMDPPYNCFPSLHVAHSFVSAWVCHRLHRPLGRACLAAASLVALSTLWTKQHYVADVVAGVALAAVARGIFLRGDAPPASAGERDAAVALAAGLLGVIGCGVAAAWAIHRWGFG